MPNILVVCTANICRSPVVAGYLQQLLQARGYKDWLVDSAGTWAVVQRGAARFSIQLMAERGINIRSHQAKMINEQLMAQSDLIICMELGHAEALQVEFDSHRHKIFTLSEMVGKKYSIADPYGGPIESYQEMVDEVTALLDAGFERIVALAKANYQRRTA